MFRRFLDGLALYKILTDIMKEFHNIILVVLLLSPLLCISQTGKWKKTLKINSAEGYEQFLHDYPESEYKDLAKEKLLELDYARVTKSEKINDYQTFLKKYPGNKYKSDVASKLIELEFEQVKENDSLEGYRAFNQKYPGSKYDTVIKNRIWDLEYDKIKSSNSPSQFEQYFMEYPYKINSRERRDSLDQKFWELASEENSVSIYRKYLQLFLNGQYVSEANKKLALIERSKWESARNSASIVEYQAFLKDFPASFKRDSAKIEIERLSEENKFNQLFGEQGINFSAMETNEPQKFASKVVYVGRGNSDPPDLVEPRDGFVFVIITLSFIPQIDIKISFKDDFFLVDGSGQGHSGIPEIKGEFNTMFTGSSCTFKSKTECTERYLFHIIKEYFKNSKFYFYGKYFNLKNN